MSMIIITALRCDQCRTEFRGYTGSHIDSTGIRKAAQGLGWTTKRDTRKGVLQDVCPRCLARSPKLRALPDADVSPAVSKSAGGGATEESTSVAGLLAALIHDSGMNLPELASAIGKGVTAKALECYRKGTVIPSAKNMRHIAAFFGLDVEEAMALRERASKARTEWASYTGCDIPLRHRKLEVDDDGVPYEKGTLFCADACPDVVNIPDECPGVCQPAQGTLGGCPLAVGCPCGAASTPERKRAFKAWLAERKRRVDTTNGQNKGIERVHAAWKWISHDDTSSSLW